MPRAGTYIRASDFATTDHVPVASPDWPPARQERLRRIAHALPAGWWTEASEPLLHEYVCALEMAETLQRLLDRLDSEGVDVTAHLGEIGHLLTARDREAKAALRLARLQRLTQLSLPARREGADTPSDPAKAPWADA
jgi:hypothetical protein